MADAQNDFNIKVIGSKPSISKIGNSLYYLSFRF